MKLGLVACVALLSLAGPAQGQSANMWGFFAKVQGKQFVTAASEKYYSTCEFRDEGKPVLACDNAWDNSAYRIEFDADGTTRTTMGGKTTPGTVEYYEKGLVFNNGKSLQFWWVDGEQNVSVSGRVVSSGGGGYAYTSSRYMRRDPYDILASVRASSRYSATYLPTDPGRAGTEALVGRIIGNISGFMGARVDPAAAAYAAVPEALPPLSAQASAAPGQASPVSTGPRFALVIGNAGYGASMGRLPNPARDAQLLAAALRTAGFTVDILLDADQRTMKAAIARFGQKLRTAGRTATGLFFYAGHGLQSRGANYLIPIGAQIGSEADVDLEAVPADGVLSQIAEADIATSIIVLDACRNVPMFRSVRGADRGLARMDAPNGSYIAYSTAPGQTATDGTGANSPFAQALSMEIRRPGQPIETTFRNVRSAVYEATDGKQTPWDSSSLFTTFYFTPPGK